MKTVIKNRKLIVGIAVVLLSCIFAAWPLFSKSYIPTHDGEYHIIRFIEFFRMISSGYWFPRWAPTLNSGYGIPVFQFHYPFPNYIGAGLQSVGFDPVYAFKLALGYILAGVCSFLWLNTIFGVRAGIVGSILSLYVPYWFVDIYVRGSVGEVWAIGFVYVSLMLLEYKKFTLFSLAIAGLILSHNILAMLFIPILMGYAYMRNKRYMYGIGIGILLSSYFWIPALFERGYVVGLNTVNFRDHFVQLYELLIPSWGTEMSGQIFSGNKMSFQLGIVSLFLMFISFFYIRKEKNSSIKKVYWYFFFISICSVFIMLSWSSKIWDIVPLLAFVQYPWRFLSLSIPVIAFIGAFVFSHIHMRVWSMVIIICSIGIVYSYTRPVTYAQRDGQYYMSRANFTDGTSSMGNSFSTIWTNWKKEKSDYVLEVTNGKVPGGLSDRSYLRKTFTLWSDWGSDVFVPILYFPGWKVYVDGRDTSIQYTIDGTIRFFVPQGKHSVVVIFDKTPIRKCADLISLIALVWLLGWGILGIYANRIRHVSHS
jgi:hypothetical protein